MDKTRLMALAGAVAVLGDGAPAAAAAGLAGLEVDEAEAGADALAAAGVLLACRPLRFAHPTLRAAIYAAMPPGARATAHRRAVRVLGACGAGPMALAAHACAVEPAGDPFVADALIEAGRLALAGGSSRQAALLLERAVAEPPALGRRPAARALLARAYTLLGDRRAAALTCEALAGASAPHDRARLAGELIDALWLTGDGDAATALARRPPGLRAAQAARDGSLPAAEIVRMARRGAGGATAFERCCAIAALIACDEVAAARDAVETCTRAACARGAAAELAMLARLRTRLLALDGAVLDATRPLGGPDPGPAPWQSWSRDAVRRFGTPAARAAALLAAPGGVEDLECAVALLRGSPRRLLLGQALLALGRAQRHAGARRAARSTLAEALALAQRLGAADLAARAADELHVAGARPRREVLSGRGSLTAAERRVAEAAAAGWRNREIAARLFLSPKTVEMHLGRVYRKLEIRSRGELPAALGAPLTAAA